MSAWLCRETQAQLPALLAGELHGLGERAVRKHVDRCADCAQALAKQTEVHSGLQALRSSTVAPPEGLLEELLDVTRRRGVRGRAAVPARGALSGARPGMSVAFVAAGLVASTGVGWAAVKGGRAVLGRRRSGSD
jgi:predicted anti-sigma-YlaC factor YlaD